MTNDVAISLAGLTKAYGRTTILRDVNATIRRGHTTVLLGANGAGKTTLMRLVAGLARPSAGRITVDGAPPQSRPGQVGILFEDPHLYPHLSGWDNLRLLSGRRPDADLDAHLAVVGLDNSVLRRRARGYSFGQRRRLTLAALAHGTSDVLLLDEPTNGLDPVGCAAFVALARRLAASGRTLFVTGQDMASLTSLAEDAYMLSDGTLARVDSWKRPGERQGLLELQTPDVARLRAALAGHLDADVSLVERPGSLVVAGSDRHLRALLAVASSLPADLVTHLALREEQLGDLFPHESGR